MARDSAFSFYYEDNLDLLRESEARIIFFSPQTDSALPPGISGLYLGGGFPEIFAAQLAANDSLKESIRQVHAAGMPIYAECGGFMYLTEAIIDLDDRPHPMVGLIPGLTRMQPRLVSLGYRIVQSPDGNFLLPKGSTTRGHEFHWSTWDPPTPALTNPNSPTVTPDAPSPPPTLHSEVRNPNSAIRIPQSEFRNPAWLIQPRRGATSPRPDGFAQGNLIASYVHLHFAHNLQLAPNFVQACRQWQTEHAA